MSYRRSQRCPRCGRSLEELGFDVGEALGCSGCGGVMLDEAAFWHVRESAYRQIVERIGQCWIDVPMQDDSPALSCPKCSSPMRRTQLDQIPVDYCSKHGIWFDRQELAVLALGLARARPSERPPPGAAGPYARTPEVAQQLAWLQEKLHQQVHRTAKPIEIERVRRMFNY